jgi:hypothetical protein
MSGEQVGPSRGYYALAAAVFVGGWVFFGIFLFKNLSGLSGRLQQVVVPGKAQLNLQAPGEYTIYYEYQSVVGSKVYSTNRTFSGLDVSLVAVGTGEPIALSQTDANSTYTVSGRSGLSVFDFRIARPGKYELSARYPEGQEGPEIVLAVGQGFVSGILTTVFGGLAIVFGSMGLAVAIAVITAVKQHNAKKRAQDRYAL